MLNNNLATGTDIAEAKSDLETQIAASESRLEGECRQRDSQRDSQGDSQGNSQEDTDNTILLQGRLRF